jgi:hypothetical protein
MSSTLPPMDASDRGARRSTLPKSAARQRYVEMGELAALQQIQRDSEALDRSAIAVGPFARLDANAVAAQDGKTRGAITNVFGSQAAFQVETMALALSAGDWIAAIEYPRPAEFATAEEWVDAFFRHESARGPRHGAAPEEVDYGFLWALWLSAVPYGLWSKTVGAPSLEEHVEWTRRLSELLQDVLDHFGLELREGVALTDLASAIENLTEGAWLNQCFTTQHPLDDSEPVATALVRAGRMLWRGAVRGS